MFSFDKTINMSLSFIRDWSGGCAIDGDRLTEDYVRIDFSRVTPTAAVIFIPKYSYYQNDIIN